MTSRLFVYTEPIENKFQLGKSTVQMPKNAADLFAEYYKHKYFTAETRRRREKQKEIYRDRQDETG